jgi:hypothetical protein
MIERILATEQYEQRHLAERDSFPYGTRGHPGRSRAITSSRAALFNEHNRHIPVRRTALCRYNPRLIGDSEGKSNAKRNTPAALQPR